MGCCYGSQLDYRGQTGRPLVQAWEASLLAALSPLRAGSSWQFLLGPVPDRVGLNHLPMLIYAERCLASTTITFL
jgi:hypothetical protein